MDWRIRGVELTPEVPIERLADLASKVESVGLDTALVACHYNNRDPFAALALAAEATTSIRLGPAAANPYESHPVALASRIATLQETSNGRALCGLGAGDRSTLRALGVDRERPLRRVLETMQVARQLWAGSSVSHDGTFSAADATLNYDVSVPPVYVGAQGPDMLAMAGKYADGVLVNAAHPRDYEIATEKIADGAAERSSDRDQVDTVAYCCTSVAADASAAREAARPPVAFIAGSAPEPVLKRHGIDSAAATAIGNAIEQGAFGEAFDQVTPAMLEAFSVTGTVEEVTQRFAALGDEVDGIVAGAPLGPEPATAIAHIESALAAASPASEQ